MTGVLVLLPLMVACLDELLVRQRRSPLLAGGVLGLLAALQFFVSTEVLAMAAVCAVAGVFLLVLYAAVGHRAALAARAPHAVRALAVAAGVGVVLLAYPAWFALGGPAHLSGLVWPTLPPGTGGSALANVWSPHSQTVLRSQMLTTGGYQGPALPEAEYLGLGLLVVLAAGLAMWRRDRRLWFFGALGVVALVLSVGLRHAHLDAVAGPGPPPPRPERRGRPLRRRRPRCAPPSCWRWSSGAPERASLAGSRAGRGGPARAADGAGTPATARRWAVAAALGVATVAVAPLVAAEAGNIPLTTTTVAVPRWFAAVGAHLPPGQVVLAYPAPFALQQSAEDWQAVDWLDFALVGGSGPGGGAGPGRPGAGRAGRRERRLVLADRPPGPDPDAPG